MTRVLSADRGAAATLRVPSAGARAKPAAAVCKNVRRLGRMLAVPMWSPRTVGMIDVAPWRLCQVTSQYESGWLASSPMSFAPAPL